MVKQLFHISFLLFLMISCKDPHDRRCFKGAGEESSLSVPIDTTEEFVLGKGLRYEIYQDTQNEIIIRGGENMISQVEIIQTDSSITIENKNLCNFLRSKNKEQITVEIHTADFYKFSGEPTDSVIFMDTVTTDRLTLDLENGAASVDLKINSDFLYVHFFNSSADITVSGEVAIKTDLILKGASYGDATNLKCSYYFLHSRTTGDLLVNLNNATADIVINGTGDIIYDGTPISLNIEKNGDGEVIVQ